jgi:site-specific DNA recombinase
MSIAAIYARKSNDQNLPDEEKSVTRQVERAHAYAARQGWVVPPEHVYTDDGISGAEFVKRPGFLALMNALKPRPPFQVLVTMEQARLGRSLDEVPLVLRRLTDAGVRVWTYLTESEIKRESAADWFMVTALAFVDDMHREQSRQRTRDALRRHAERGHVAGGLCYGYRNVREAGHVRREILEAEAAIVRRIFQAVADGAGYVTVATHLNADGIPAPRGGGAWVASSIRAMLYRELYRGRPQYGLTRWVDSGGTKRKERVRDAASWVTTQSPALAIVSDELWPRAHRRLEAARILYPGRPRRTPHQGRLPPVPTSGRYLLTGVLQCGHCGGGLQMSRQSGRRGRGLWLYYVCSRQRTRGIPCPGALRLRAEQLDAAMLEEIGERLLTPRVLRTAVNRAVARLRPQADDRARRRALEAERQAVERELAPYADAIAAGGSIPALVTAMQTRERRRVAIEAELAALDRRQRPLPLVDAAAIAEELRQLCEDWRARLREDGPIAQKIIRELFPPA